MPSIETDYPPLTDQHVLNAFKGSGITLGEVMHLGCLLDIPRAEMEVLKLEQRANPAMCAMLTIHEWKKRDPECVNLHYAYKRLHEVLQACKLNCIIPHLHSLDASKNIGLFIQYHTLYYQSFTVYRLGKDYAEASSSKVY